MWRESPLFGADLGVFIERSTDWYPIPIIVHSTPVWILAEFGLVGVAFSIWALLSLYISSYRNGWRLTENRIVALLIIAFLVFGLAHEILYQRLFWLMLGAVMAAPLRPKTTGND